MIAVDAIGNGHATSPSNSRQQPRMRFPRFGIRDMVTAQHRLLTEHLGIHHVHAVVGLLPLLLLAPALAFVIPSALDVTTTETLEPVAPGRSTVPVIV